MLNIKISQGHDNSSLSHIMTYLRLSSLSVAISNYVEQIQKCMGMTIVFQK